jgi:acyl-CoA thioesterase
VHPFDAATAVTPQGDGHFSARLDPAWSNGDGPHGGVLAAMVTRALTATLDDPGLAPRALTLHYLRAPSLAQPIEVSVDIERRGRRTSTLSARVTQDGRPAVLALATYIGGLEQWRSWEPAPRAIAGPQEIEPSPPFEGRPPFLDFLEQRVGLGGAMFGGGDSALSGGWLDFAAPREIDAPAIAFFCDAWVPTAFMRLRDWAIVPTLELTIHFVVALGTPLPAGPLQVRFDAPSAAGGTFDEDGEVWSASGRLLARSRQSELLQPI